MKAAISTYIGKFQKRQHLSPSYNPNYKENNLNIKVLPTRLQVRMILKYF